MNGSSPARPSEAPDAEGASVRVHRWEGYRCESRVVRSPSPRVAPVLLVGGALQRKEDWGRLERELLRHADVVSVDLPGWGAGDPLPERFGVDFLTEALRHMLTELDPGPVNVLGGSYGTAPAYRLAELDPARVARLVLVGTMPAIPEHARGLIEHTLDLFAAGRMTEFARAGVELLMSSTPGADVAAGAAVRRVLLHRFARISPEEGLKYTENTRRLLAGAMLGAGGGPAQPVLVTTGEHDTFTTPALCRQVAAGCADSWFVEVARGDHMLHLERAPELVELAARFYAGESFAELPFVRRAERVRGAAPVPAPVRAGARVGLGPVAAHGG
ncbi:alpha/beta fold hydrolase [Streptomyces alkaliphilus]|uniref:Alpha/beta fold hydrolase n=1 Tax=Streptomyces alkaliphilus TaxID=1472722 RepID=A0A7W3Y2F5_9ACTN|nr:alpha/beta fold hydrolase [Streptomyces alkaliphilus]MBB0245488.1 alpha/beta fold hydrolase [Streptomyces alkaliphilus]